MEVDKEIGQRIRTLRKARGWSVRDMAPMLEVSYTYLAALERGDKPWKAEMIAQVAEIFKISPSLLQDPSVPLERLPQIAEVVDRVSHLSEEQFEAVLQLLKSLQK